MDQNNPKKLHKPLSPTIITNFKNQQTIKDENGWEDQKIDPTKNRGNRQGRGNRNQENQTHSGRRMISYENEHEDADSNFEENNDSDHSNDQKDQKQKDSLSFSQVEQSKTKQKEENKEVKNEKRTNEYEQILKDLSQEKDVGVGNRNGSDKKQENKNVKQTQFQNEDDEMESSWFQDSQQSESKKNQNTSVSLIEKQIKSDHQDINTTLTVNSPKITQKYYQPNQNAQRGNRGNRQIQSDFKKKTFHQDSDQNYRSNQNYRDNREGPRDYGDNHTKRYYGDSYEMGRGGRGGRGDGRGDVRGGGRGGTRGGGRGGRGTNFRERQEYTNSFRQNRERQLNQNQDYSNGPRHNNFNGYNRQQTNYRDNGNRQSDNRGNRDNGFREEEHVPRNYNNGKYNESDRISNRNNRDQPENYPRNNREEPSNMDRNYQRNSNNNNRPIRNTHHQSQESKQKQQQANKIKNTPNLKEVGLKQPNKGLSIEPRGQKCWPQVSIYIQSTKLTFGYRQITQYECDVIIIPYKNLSFDIYPGNIMNRCSVDYREKIHNKGEEIAKIGSLYAQKCVGIPNFKIFGFLKIGTGNMKQSLSQIIPQLKKVKANFQTVLIPFSKDMGQPKQFIQTIAESINGNRGFTEIHLSTNNAKEYRQGFKCFCEFIDQLIQQNKICIDF